MAYLTSEVKDVSVYAPNQNNNFQDSSRFVPIYFAGLKFKILSHLYIDSEYARLSLIENSNNGTLPKGGYYWNDRPSTNMYLFGIGYTI